jgi:hypothetical protein
MTAARELIPIFRLKWPQICAIHYGLNMDVKTAKFH